ncbi:MAG TPA: bifunctional chorismate mutase/prephenate dehydratase [Clostridiales bacterium]|nr:bifunctional chorismate mutase/prephenate dehydratase [Clostridiales bacterium]
MNSLEEAREAISRVDGEMAELFTERMRAAEQVAAYKKEHGLPITDAAREAEVIRRGAERVEDPILREYYVRFIQETMALSRAYQTRLLEGMRVAYSGTEGAFAHIATGKLFPSAKKLGFPDFESAYRAVERGDCDAAVLPVENSTNGEVGQVMDLMFSGGLFINRMLDLPVTQDLLVKQGTSIEEIRTVISHPQALGQCAARIREMGWQTEEYPNTALAAKFVAGTNDRTVAAIASAEAAEQFGLAVLERNLNASRSNTTRFAVFTRAENTQTKGTCSALMFTVRNEAGALARAIDVIGHYGFNMRTLRSRPMKELLWQYYFYVEAEGDLHTPDGQNMLRALSVFCDKLKPVGCYTVS